jgi:hypothetical protein
MKFITTEQIFLLNYELSRFFIALRSLMKTVYVFPHYSHAYHMENTAKKQCQH